MSQVVFECTALVGTNKQGVLTPDADGYYELVIGGLGTYNSAGAWYDLNESRKMFESSTSFMRRVNDGVLCAELDHPEKTSIQSMRDYMGRLMQIKQDRICAHFKKIWLDDTKIKDENGRPFCAVIALVKPYGPYKDMLEDALKNNAQNVCFSIRSFTEDKAEGGRLVKKIREIITFDCVLEPGIAKARKWYAPALEALMLPIAITRDILSGIIEDRQLQGLGAEDSVTASIESLQTTIQWDELVKASKTPPSLQWK